MEVRPVTLAHKRGFSTPQAAEYIGRSASWLRKKRLRGADDPTDPGPKFRKPATGSVLYLKEDLDAWLDAQDEASMIAPKRARASREPQAAPA